MRGVFGIAAVLLITISVTSHAAEKNWPSTPAGTVAKGWVTAFNGGDGPMRQFIAGKMAGDGRRVEERMKSYRKLRKEMKTLMFVRVDDAAQYELDVTLADAAGDEHQFTFRVQPKAPHKLELVGRLEYRHGH